MTKTVQTSIKCDGCEKELIKVTSMPHVYAFELDSIDCATRGGADTYAICDVIVHDPVPKKKHFCSVECIHAWATTVIDGVKARKAEAAARRATRGY